MRLNILILSLLVLVFYGQSSVASDTDGKACGALILSVKPQFSQLPSFKKAAFSSGEVNALFLEAGITNQNLSAKEVSDALVRSPNPSLFLGKLQILLESQKDKAQGLSETDALILFEVLTYHPYAFLLAIAHEYFTLNKFGVGMRSYEPQQNHSFTVKPTFLTFLKSPLKGPGRDEYVNSVWENSFNFDDQFFENKFLQSARFAAERSVDVLRALTVFTTTEYSYGDHRQLIQGRDINGKEVGIYVIPKTGGRSYELLMTYLLNVAHLEHGDLLPKLLAHIRKNESANNFTVDSNSLRIQECWYSGGSCKPYGAEARSSGNYYRKVFGISDVIRNFTNHLARIPGDYLSVEDSSIIPPNGLVESDILEILISSLEIRLGIYPFGDGEEYSYVDQFIYQMHPNYTDEGRIYDRSIRDILNFRPKMKSMVLRYGKIR